MIKIVQIRIFFWSLFPPVWTEYRKIQTRKNSYLDAFHALFISNWSLGLRIAVFGLVSYIKKRNRSWCRSQIKKKKWNFSLLNWWPKNCWIWELCSLKNYCEEEIIEEFYKQDSKIRSNKVSWRANNFPSFRRSKHHRWSKGYRGNILLFRVCFVLHVLELSRIKVFRGDFQKHPWKVPN